jgi:glyoxylase-like metal-dependent hydrolase (beta-lactamase superfamily II)
LLEQVASGLWVVTSPLRFLGIEVGTRMTVVRLEGGELLLHSPIAASDALRRELDALGRVRYVIAPNRFHHLYAGDYAQAYPESRLFVAPGLERKRRDLVIDSVLCDEAPAGWADELQQLVFRGFPLANEVVFFHPSTRTLILSDLAFNIDATSPPMTRGFFRILRAYERFGPSLMERLGIRDRAAARESLHRILAWDFDRVIVAHGKVLDRGGREALRTGYAWLLHAPGSG